MTGKDRDEFEKDAMRYENGEIVGAVDNVLRADMVITISTGVNWQNAT
jgi:hypothetical protein